MLSRREALHVVISGAGVALLAACGPAAVQAPPPTAAPATKPAPPAPTAAAPAAAQPAAPPTSVSVSTPAKSSAAQPKLGGTLRFAATADVPNLDGHQRSAALQDTVWTAYDRLIRYDAEGKAQPMLAESWDVTPDFKQIKFNLRKGVQFHTGRELTSDDVKWNILRVRDPKVGSGSYVTWSSWFTTIETPDKNTLVLKTESSRPSMFDFFEWLNIVDPVTMEGPDARTKSIGTGPFVLDEWKQGESLTFSKNKNYWQTGKPYIDGFVARVVEPKSALI
ncbi:MAG TPA: ABC transporter substrate-binding protein, partial [Chloroflexota bacterium]|nr:ABC transporter substrate-binding protein [Chloroflexota bacterium]